MSLTFFIGSGASTNVVQLLSADLSREGESGTVFSGLRFDSDGNLYARQTAGGLSSLGAWLLSGTAGDFTLVRTIDSGSLTTDAGASVTMGSDRDFDIQVNANRHKITQVTYDIELTAAPGVSLVNRTYTFEAERGFL